MTFEDLVEVVALQILDILMKIVMYSESKPKTGYLTKLCNSLYIVNSDLACKLQICRQDITNAKLLVKLILDTLEIGNSMLNFMKIFVS